MINMSGENEFVIVHYVMEFGVVTFSFDDRMVFMQEDLAQYLMNTIL